MTAEAHKRLRVTPWIARAAVLFIFLGNMWCALAFLVSPGYYALSFELTGVPGSIAIQGLAVAFLMWNATYPLVIINPVRYRAMFAVVLVQQALGLVCETILYTQIGAGHEQLASSLLRFIGFDGAGLLVMGAAYIVLSIGLARGRAAQDHEPVP
ncbi:MAG: hypothetical protein LBJ48_02790 [Coriobacteriales bacterium]|jgi:hypothetical protein|nr:hypothetical protein [Coriobacteriales bacterium]